ncbi:MAG: deoxyhypusine synthase family protein [Thermodesulfobacteriota bacterium]
MSDENDHIRLINELGNPEDEGFEPLALLDPERIHDFDDLLTAMSQTAFGGRGLGEALDVLQEMVQDPECHVVGTFSGAMTVAKMGQLLCTMIDNGWVDTVVSTGALMAHGFIESIGLKHYKYVPERMNDDALFKRGFNRVYDTLEPEINFAQAEDVVHAVMTEIKDWDRMSSAALCRAIGGYLQKHFRGPGILKSAYAREVPVFIPAFTDSELALDVASHILRHCPQAVAREGMEAALPFHFNPFYDLFEYTRRACGAKRLGIFTIGGGVPRNWAQQVGPFVEIVNQRVEGLDLPLRRFQYGVRICPEPSHWGGLSGCTYQEGISWGKFVPPLQGGRFAEVHSDATIAWPLLIKGLQNRLAKGAATT